MTNIEHRNPDYLKTVFSDISDWIYEQIGLEFPKNEILFELYKNTRGELSIQGKLGFKGPMQRRGNNPTIKLDLCWDEVFVEPSIRKPICHPYTDKQFSFYVQAYCIDEIFAEKLRALVERMRPRDLYDIIHLFNDTRWSLNREKVFFILEKKCAYKSVPVPTIEYINSMPERIDLETDWDNMLAHQIYGLEQPGFYWEKLPAVFDWLNNR